MEDLKQILQELESIEVSLKDNDVETASIDLHLLIVEILDKIKYNAQYILKVNRNKIKGEKKYGMGIWFVSIILYRDGYVSSYH